MKFDTRKFPSIHIAVAAAMRARQTPTIKPNAARSKGKQKQLDELHSDFVKESSRILTKQMWMRSLQKERGQHGFRVIKKVPPISWKSMTSSYLPWSNFDEAMFGATGCGPMVLGQLTHTNPIEVRAMIRPMIKKDWPQNLDGNILIGTPEEVMMSYLQMFNIFMIPLGYEDLCPSFKGSDTFTEKHVILADQHLAKDNRSWVVYYNVKRYHNAEVEVSNIYDLLRFPTENLYLLYCPDWRFMMKGRLDIVAD